MNSASLVNKKCVFIGGVQIGVDCLRLLVKAGVRPQLVIANLGDEGGDKSWHESLVKVAQAENLPVVIGQKVSAPEVVARLKEIQPEIIFCIGGMQIIPPEILRLPRLGCLNIHPALLPKYRGRYSTAHAIFNGEKYTGVTLHWMDKGVDSGPVISQEKIIIEPTDTAKTLYQKFTSVGAQMFEKFLTHWLSGAEITAVLQNDAEATYYPKGLPGGGEIDWSWSGEQIHNFIRAMTFEPFSPPSFKIGDKTMVIVDEKYFKGFESGSATKNSFGPVTRCQICQTTGLVLILPLGHQPPAHSHLTAVKLSEPEVAFPLNLVLCPACHLLQLDYVVDPRILFPPDYPYQTGLTRMLVDNFRSLAALLVERYHLDETNLVIDIGSNDGTLLQGFLEKGVRVLGVEPTDAAKIANSRGLETIQTYFDDTSPSTILAKYGSARVVTATNVFAHIHNPSQLVKNIGALLSPDGVFVSESQYLLDIFHKMEFDTVYHEHLRYYSLKPLQKLFAINGFTLIDAERITAAGGSIRVYAQKGNWPVSPRVNELIAAEEQAGLYDRERLREFARRSVSVKRALLGLLLECKKSGARIYGLGGPCRSNTLLNFSKIDGSLIEVNCEKKGSPKIGLYTPGAHIPVVDEERIFQDQPEYVLVLSWHIGEELMKKIRSLGYRGQFIVPLPIPRIVTDI